MKRFVSVCIAAVAAFMLSGCGMHTVDTGHRGIKVSFGQVEGEPLTEGLYFVNPFTTSIHQLDTRTQVWSAKDDAYTKDVQEATINFTLNYSLQQDAVGTVYRTVGEDWGDKLVSQNVHNPLKAVVGHWDAVDLISHLGDVNAEASKLITTTLAAQHVTVSNFQITKVSYTPAFNRAVELKVIAQQQAEQAQNKTEQIKQEAQQKVISATAEAQSMKI